MFRRTHVIICAICLGIGFLGSLLPVLPDAEEQLGLHLLYRLRVPEKPRTGVIVMAISRMTIEKRVSAVPLLADAAIAQTPFPLPKVPIKLNQYWRFGPGTTEQPTLPVVVMHAFAKAVFSDFIALLRKTDPQAASKLPALSRSESTVQDVIKAILPTYHLFQRHPSLADRMAAVLRHDSRGSPLSPTHRQVSAFIDLYSAGSSSYLNFYRPPGTVETVSYHELLAESESRPDPVRLASLRGKAVFVGQTESDWFKANDGFYTAFTEKTGMDISGAEVAATAFANILDEKGIHPFGAAPHLSILLCRGGLCAVIAVRFPSIISAAGLLVVDALYLGLAHLQFKSYGVGYPLVIPMLVQTPAAFIAGLGWKYRKANIERRNIREAFGYFLPNEVVNRLAPGGTQQVPGHTGAHLRRSNGHVTRPMDKFIFKGKSQPVQIFEIIQKNALSPQLQAEAHRLFTAALHAFEEQRWDDADQLFTKVLEIDDSDGPSKFYRQLCEELRQVPPNSDWNGSVYLKSK